MYGIPFDEIKCLSKGSQHLIIILCNDLVYLSEAIREFTARFHSTSMLNFSSAIGEMIVVIVHCFPMIIVSVSLFSIDHSYCFQMIIVIVSLFFKWTVMWSTCLFGYGLDEN